MDTSTLWPQNYLFSCELKANRDDHFKVDNDENGHKLSLKTVSLGAVAKDELHIVETEAMNYEGSPIKVTLATLETSVRPMVSLGGFERTPPVVLGLKCGSGPVHISGQHLVVVEEEAESGDEEEEDVKLLSISGKQSAPGGGSKVLPQEVAHDSTGDPQQRGLQEKPKELTKEFCLKIAATPSASLSDIRIECTVLKDINTLLPPPKCSPEKLS
ncbi:hypothetical protein H8959_013589 [Pygathrix nigripes]